MRTLGLPLLAIALSLSAPIRAEETGTGKHHASSYAGQENRSIKSLSESDVAELREGSGWGLAKAAELNGVPGPAHLLELRDEIGLDEEQVNRLEALFERMKAEAVTVGRRLVEQERALDARFRSDVPSSEELEALLDEIGATRSKLRFVHLDAHLQTPDLLTGEQIARYNELRGYTSADPCENIPEGHPVEMWKKHNGCD